MLEMPESDAECVSLLPNTHSMLAIVYPAISFPMRIIRPVLTYLQRHSWSYRHYACIRRLDVPQRKLVALTLS